MKPMMFATVVALGFPRIVWPQPISDHELLRRLVNQATQHDVVGIVAKDHSRITTLLSWADNPPTDVDKYNLYIALADVFAELRAKEAIPFLIAHISLNRLRFDGNTFMKTAEVIEDRMPAVHALIRIGPDASLAIIKAYWGTMRRLDREAAVFSVSRIGGPEARQFLNDVIALANDQRSWAERGLKEIARH